MSCSEWQRRIKSFEENCNCDLNMFCEVDSRRSLSAGKLRSAERKHFLLTGRHSSDSWVHPCATQYSDTSDQLPVYANTTIRSMSFRFLFLILATVMVPASSQTTVTNDFPPGCIFLQSSNQLVDKVIDDDRLVLAWGRLWSGQEDVVVRAYCCKSTGLSVIPKGITANVEAVYLDENSIANVKKADIIPNTGDVTVRSPTLAISLCSNQITSIESEVFRSLPELKLLALKNNSLQNLQWTVSSNPIFEKLMELDLSMNQIVDLGSQEFGSFPALRRLDLSGNDIRHVDGTILSKLPKLEYLDLSSNHITERALTPSGIEIQSLRFLSVADNFLGDFGTSHVAKFLKKLPNLTTLDVSLNKISSGIVPKDAFYGFSSVRTLNLSGCGIKKLRKGWLDGGLSSSLKILDLSYNLLEAISAHSLSPQTERVQNETLKAAKSGSTNATAVEDIQNGNAIEVLFLNGNYRLSRIEDDVFYSVPNLKLLFLQNCDLRRFNIASSKYRYGDDPIATTLPFLTNVWIFGNPISCDCYVRFLKEWSVSTVSVHQKKNIQRYIDAPSYTIDSQRRTVSTEFSICVAPESLAGLTVQAAPGKSMTCQEEPYSMLVAMLIGPLTFAGSVALTILCGSLHVCIARMKRGAVLSYHAREELMRNPKVRHRRSAPQPIISTFGWRHSHDDLSTYSTGSRSGRHTNLVLGNFEDHHHRREVSHARNRLSPEMALAASSASFHAEERRGHSRTHSAGYCSGTDTARNEIHGHSTSPQVMNGRHLEVKRKVRGSGSDADSVLGKESVRTRSPSNDIPFIDEKGRGENHKSSLGRLSSSTNGSNNSSSASLLDGERYLAADSRHPGDELRLRKPLGQPETDAGQNSSRQIPGLSSNDRPNSAETSL